MLSTLDCVLFLRGIAVRFTLAVHALVGHLQGQKESWKMQIGVFDCVLE